MNSENVGELNMQILAELKSLGGRMPAMEEEMASKKATEVTQSPQQASATASNSLSPAHLDQMVVPMVAALQGSWHIQAEVDQWIRQLVDLNEAGKSKSQRGGNKIAWVKRQVPWPQNFVLGGTIKVDFFYDALNLCQWICNYCYGGKKFGN